MWTKNLESQLFIESFYFPPQKDSIIEMDRGDCHIFHKVEKLQ